MSDIMGREDAAIRAATRELASETAVAVARHRQTAFHQ